MRRALHRWVEETARRHSIQRVSIAARVHCSLCESTHQARHRAGGCQRAGCSLSTVSLVINGKDSGRVRTGRDPRAVIDEVALLHATAPPSTRRPRPGEGQRDSDRRTSAPTPPTRSSPWCSRVGARSTATCRSRCSFPTAGTTMTTRPCGARSGRPRRPDAREPRPAPAGELRPTCPTVTPRRRGRAGAMPEHRPRRARRGRSLSEIPRVGWDTPSRVRGRRARQGVAPAPEGRACATGLEREGSARVADLEFDGSRRDRAVERGLRRSRGGLGGRGVSGGRVRRRPLRLRRAAGCRALGVAVPATSRSSASTTFRTPELTDPPLTSVNLSARELGARARPAHRRATCGPGSRRSRERRDSLVVAGHRAVTTRVGAHRASSR